MADRDMYRTDQNTWDRGRRAGGPDAADRMDADRYDWSAGDEGRSFGRDPSQAGHGQYSRGDQGRGGRDYGGQGAWGQGRSPGGYGYGAQVEGRSEPQRDGERFGQRDERTPDYDRGGQGGYAQGGGYARDSARDGGRDQSGFGSTMERAAYARWGYEPGLEQDRSPREFYGQPGQRERHAHDHDPHYSHWRASQLDAHDRDYSHWRDQQAKRYDDDYGAWRNEKHQAFSKDFDSWRSGRDKARQQPTDLTVSPPEVENVSDGKSPSADRNKN